MSDLTPETLAKWREGAVIESTMCTYHPRGIYGKRILALLDALREMADSRQEARNEHRAAVAEREALRAALATEKAHAEEAEERGYLKGYEDGLMDPGSAWMRGRREGDET